MFYVLLCIHFSHSVNANPTLEDEYTRGFYYAKEHNYNKAFTIMFALAHKGYSQAKHNVALSYLHGLGIPQDKKEAHYWLTQAHEDNITDATVELANMYYDDGHTTKAISLWQQAADDNDEYALFNLAMVSLEQNDKKLAKKYLLRAQKFNHPNATYFLQKYF